MNLRLAKKICKAMSEGHGDRYSGWQQLQAVNRNERTKSAKADSRFWNEMMETLGVEGRAEITASWNPAAAFKMLVEGRGLTTEEIVEMNQYRHDTQVKGT